MSRASLLGFLAFTAVTWAFLRNHTPAARANMLDHKIPLRALRGEQYIPLH
jgi:hypothetical protein